MNEGTTYIQHSGISLLAEGYLDTVSIIRGNLGRPPLKEEDRIYFMKKKISISEGGRINTSNALTYEFLLEATEEGE